VIRCPLVFEHQRIGRDETVSRDIVDNTDHFEHNGYIIYSLYGRCANYGDGLIIMTPALENIWLSLKIILTV